MADHVHEFRFHPNYKPDPRGYGTYAFVCVCDEAILLPEAERRINAMERLEKLIADLQEDSKDGPNEMGGPFVALSVITSALEGDNE